MSNSPYTKPEFQHPVAGVPRYAKTARKGRRSSDNSSEDEHGRFFGRAEAAKGQSSSSLQPSSIKPDYTPPASCRENSSDEDDHLLFGGHSGEASPATRAVGPKGTCGSLY